MQQFILNMENYSNAILNRDRLRSINLDQQGILKHRQVRQLFHQ
jgi:hypothetical protein